MAAQYLIESANAMVGALKYVEEEGGAQIDPRSLQIYLGIGCRTLTTLVNDREFSRDLYTSNANQKAAAISEFREFIAAFIRIDRGMMIDAGMDQKMVNYLFKDARYLLDKFANDAMLDPKYLQARLWDLSKSVCDRNCRRR